MTSTPAPARTTPVPPSGLQRWSTGAPPLAPHVTPSGMEPVQTWANLVTVIRTVGALALGFTGVVTDSLLLLVVGYLVYWIGDSADGNVARWLNQETRQGAVFDIVCDRACTCVLALGYIAHDHKVVLPLAIYLLQFMVVDMMLTLTFLFWPLVSPNYFYRADRPVYLLNWSKTAKTFNTTVVVTLTAIGWIIPAAIIATIVLAMKDLVAQPHRRDPRWPDGRGDVSGAFLGHFLLIAGSFGFGIASALIPIINAEAYVLAVCATAKPGPATFAMIALVLGTLAGKLVLFLGARYREKLGRFLHLRHRDAVNTAEAGIARGIAAEIAAGEAALAQSGQTVMTDQASQSEALPVPVKTSRRRWLPPAPAWLVRTKQAIVAWGDRALHLLDKPWQSAGVLMASATLGVPPLAVTTIAAGLRKTSLPVFIACVVIGRGARFAVIAVPTLLARN